MLKTEPTPEYPLEEGHYLRGNDYSPVAVAVVLIFDNDKIPKEIEDLVRGGSRPPIFSTFPLSSSKDSERRYHRSSIS